MSKQNSAPTARVIDVLELLSQPGSDRLRFSDVARELGLAQGTANAILATLADRGWVDRDPHDKRYSIGAGLSLLALRVQTDRVLAHLATEAARRLADQTGFAVSLTERVADELVIIAFEGGESDELRGHPGDRIAYAPPFGLTFVAWAEKEEQLAWMHRATWTPAVLDGLRGLLASTRDRGYSVDWMTDAMAEVAQVIEALGSSRRGSLSSVMGRIMDELLIEYLGPDGRHASPAPGRRTPVIVVSAPVFDEHGRVAFNLSLHPLKPLTKKETARLGEELLAVSAELTASLQ